MSVLRDLKCCGKFSIPTRLLLFFILSQCLLCYAVGQMKMIDPATTTETGVSYTIFNHSLLLCPKAHVCGKCQPDETVYQNEASACGCDDMCSWFNDCCYDVDDTCVTPNADKLDFYRRLSERQISRQDVTCVVPTRDNIQSRGGVWMISRCPKTTRDTVESRKCQENDGIDIYETIPVTDKFGLTYTNAYCAICHGVSTTNLTTWNIKAHCDDYIMSLLQKTLAGGKPFLPVLELLSRKCSLSYSPSEHVGPLGNRTCVDTIEVKQCVEGVDESIFEICNNYTAYILDCDDVDKARFEGHRNAHCFQCSHGFLYNVMDCELEIPVVARNAGRFPAAPHGPKIIPISALVNFNPNGIVTIKVEETVVTQTVVRCPEGAVYDPFSDQCRLLSCPAGSHLFDEFCIPSAESTGCSMSDIQYELSVTVNTSSPISSQLNIDVQMCLANLLQMELFDIDTSSFGSFPSDISKLSTSSEFINQESTVTFNFLIKAEEATSVFDIQTVFDSVFIVSPNNTHDYQPCGVVEATLSQTCLSFPNCSNINTRSEFSFITISDTLYIFANATNRIYHILQQQLYLSYTRLVGNDIAYRKKQIANICDNPLNCPLVTKKASEFQIVNNSTGTVLHILSGMEFDMEEYQITTEGDIQLCNSVTNDGNSTEVISFVAYSRPQIIVTLVGYITSMFGEAITFLTYCMFRSLRNRTSHSIMNLVFALFIGQLLLLVGGGRTEPAQLCTTLAILLHYFFLSTFSWSSVLSYDLFLIFGADNGPVRVDGSRRLLLRYMTFAWCLPLLIILPCVIVHFCNCSGLSFRYGSQMSCWINNEYANLLVFGLPLVISFLFNAFNFCRTVWGIHVSKRDKSNRAPTEAARQKKYQELQIYAKIASLLGFTWIFAFISEITGMSAFWYIYIVLNSFQGLYIFLAFTFNSMVWKLWKRKLCLSQGSNKTNSTSNRNRSAGVAEDLRRPSENVNEIVAYVPPEEHSALTHSDQHSVPSDTQI